MKQPLRVLLVEDCEDDALLMLGELRRSGYDPVFARVDTASAMAAALDGQVWDVVICDWRMPGFDGLEALKLMQARHLDMPFLLVSGINQEDVAVAAMRAGAQDYLLKDDLARLAPVLERELRNASTRHEHREAEKEILKLNVELEARITRRTSELELTNDRLRREIAEREKIEVAFHETEKTFRALFETSRDALMIADERGFLDCNKEALRLFGCSSKDQLISKHPAEFSPPYQPDGTDSLTAARERIAVAHARGSLFFEWMHKQLDGTVFPAEVMLSRFESHGRTVHQSMVRDISERRQAETARREHQEALQESESRYRQLVASVTDYIYSVTIRDSHAVSTLHAPGCVKLTGYTSEEYANDRDLWFRMVHEEDRDAVLLQAARSVAGETVPLEHRIIHKDGSIRWVRNTPVARKDAQGRVTSYDGLVSDITERKVAEEALHKAVADLEKSHEELRASQVLLINTEKLETTGQLAAGVAHEVKNPLAILLLSLDYLSRVLPNPRADVVTVLKDMKAATLRADAIIRGLLDFSASEELELKPDDLNSIIENASLLVKHSLTLGHISLIRDLAPSLPPVAVDKNKVGQVFVNLFTNSIDAMPAGGTLTVRTYSTQLLSTEENPGARTLRRFRADDSVVVVEIEDTGTGIPPEKLSRIFDPFFTTKPPGKGTGIGLTVTSKIIDLHGGNLEIANRPEGGVRCVVRFHALNEAAPQTRRDV